MTNAATPPSRRYLPAIIHKKINGWSAWEFAEQASRTRPDSYRRDKGVSYRERHKSKRQISAFAEFCRSLRFFHPFGFLNRLKET